MVITMQQYKQCIFSDKKLFTLTYVYEREKERESDTRNFITYCKS